MSERKEIHTVRYAGLDRLKTLCALLVICAHAPFAGGFGGYFEDICSLAVPCFFMVSGFFFPRALEQGREGYRIGRIARMTGLSMLLYFVWMFVFYRWTGQDVHVITDYLFSFRGMVKFLFFNNVGFAHHLWYLSALLFVLIIVSLAWRWGLMKPLFLLCPFLLLAGIAMGRYADVVFHRFVSLEFSRNAYCLGLPFFCAGFFIAQNADRIRCRLKKQWLLPLALLFGLLSIGEHLLLEHLGRNMEGDMFLSTAPGAICLFLYFCFFDGGSPRLSAIGRECSTGIYLIHVAVLDILYTILSKTPFVVAYEYIAPVPIFLTSMLLVMLWNAFVKRRRALS